MEKKKKKIGSVTRIADPLYILYTLFTASPHQAPVNIATTPLQRLRI